MGESRVAKPSMKARYKRNVLVLVTDSNKELRIRILAQSKDEFIFEYLHAKIRFRYGVDGYEARDLLGVAMPNFSLSREELDFFQMYAKLHMTASFWGLARRIKKHWRDLSQPDLFDG